MDDVWRIAVDIYSFGWLPLWARIALTVLAGLAAILVAGLLVGRFIFVGQGGDP